jgi:hypothetical protein
MPDRSIDGAWEQDDQSEEEEGSGGTQPEENVSPIPHTEAPAPEVREDNPELRRQFPCRTWADVKPADAAELPATD